MHLLYACSSVRHAELAFVYPPPDGSWGGGYVFGCPVVCPGERFFDIAHTHPLGSVDVPFGIYAISTS